MNDFTKQHICSEALGCSDRPGHIKPLPDTHPLKARWLAAGRRQSTPASALTAEALDRQTAGYAPDYAITTAEALGYAEY